DPLVPTAGASGAIFGLLGAQAVILLRLKRSPTPVLAVIAINVIISITIPGISLWGHMGGLVAGAAATAALLYAPAAVSAKDRRSAGTAGWVALGGIGLLTLIITAAAVAAI
ncbi:rhomboid family intramembrane serine protease, partial [Rhodococcus hoagii]|nr:rhomboid family intramembrane serine protease [Prescottella equi]